MGVFTLDYGNHGAKIVAAFEQAYNYQDEVDDGEGNMVPNPETKAQFAKRKVRDYVKEIMDAYVDPVIQAEQDSLDAAKAASAAENDSISIS